MNSHQSVTELYGELLKRLRGFALADAAKSRECRSCGGRESSHLPDGRCNGNAGSFSFAPKDADDQLRAEQSLACIEQLAAIQGWNL